MAKTIWPTLGQLQAAYTMWHKGGISLAQIKTKTGIRFAEQRGYFLKAGTKAEQTALLKAKRMASVQAGVVKSAPKKAKKATVSVKVTAIDATSAGTTPAQVAEVQS